MLLYTELSPWYYDELDRLPGEYYTQAGVIQTTLDLTATQFAQAIYIQEMDISLGIYTESVQEVGSTSFYNQAGAATIAMSVQGAHFHLTPHQQSGSATLGLTLNVGQAYYDGSPIERFNLRVGAESRLTSVAAPESRIVSVEDL